MTLLYLFIQLANILSTSQIQLAFASPLINPGSDHRRSGLSKRDGTEPGKVIDTPPEIITGPTYFLPPKDIGKISIPGDAFEFAFSGQLSTRFGNGPNLCLIDNSGPGRYGEPIGYGPCDSNHAHSIWGFGGFITANCTFWQGQMMNVQTQKCLEFTYDHNVPSKPGEEEGYPKDYARFVYGKLIAVPCNKDPYEERLQLVRMSLEGTVMGSLPEVSSEELDRMDDDSKARMWFSPSSVFMGQDTVVEALWNNNARVRLSSQCAKDTKEPPQPPQLPTFLIRPGKDHGLASYGLAETVWRIIPTGATGDIHKQWQFAKANLKDDVKCIPVDFSRKMYPEKVCKVLSG